MLSHRGHAWVGKGVGAFTTVFISAQEAKNGGGIGLFSLGGNLAEDFFDGAKLFRLVVNDEISFVSEFLDVLTENPDTERMKCADGWALWFFAVGIFCRARKQLGHTFLHLTGSLV